MSRKAKRKSGEAAGQRETGGDTGGKSTTWAFVLGIFMVFLTLLAAHATLREIYIGMHRGDYVRDELVVSSVSSLDDSPSLHGQMASSGESITVPLGVAGPDSDRFCELQRAGQIEGQRVPVWYLPQETPWWMSGPDPVRLIHVSRFEDCWGGWRTGVAITVLLVIVTVWLLAYGIKRLEWTQEPAT